MRDEETDESDRPKRRSRREGRRDRAKRKRKTDSSRPLLLSLIGGAVLLCGALFAAVWFGQAKPAAERAKAENDRTEAEINRKLNEGNTPPPAGPGNGAQSPVPNNRVTDGNRPAETAPSPAAKPDGGGVPVGETVIAVAADALTAEFARDSMAAAAKYEGKWLKVTGTVSFTDPMKGEVIRFPDVTVGPAGKGKKYRTACLFEGDARAEAKLLKHPDVASIVGRCGGVEKSAKKGDTYTVTLTACRVER